MVVSLTSSYSIWCSLFPIFVLCMCSFLTRSRGNAHSSSSSICSVNSLWVMTSLLQYVTLHYLSLIPLPPMFNPVFLWCHHFILKCPKQHDSSSVITPSDRAVWVLSFHCCVCVGVCQWSWYLAVRGWHLLPEFILLAVTHLQKLVVNMYCVILQAACVMQIENATPPYKHRRMLRYLVFVKFLSFFNMLLCKH